MKRLVCLLMMYSLVAVAYAVNPFKERNPQLLVEVGGYALTHSSTTQHVDIDGLIGDKFTVTRNNNWNAIVGLGYYVDGNQTHYADLYYGIHAFYLAGATIAGNVIQEDIFTNLAYAYRVTNWPIFFSARAKINRLSTEQYHVLVDVGIGPDIVQTNRFHEVSLDNGQTHPDTIFAGQTGVSFAATAGISFRINHVFGQLPAELGYKFMYLGPVNLKNLKNQTSSFSTANNYINALTCTIVI